MKLMYFFGLVVLVTVVGQATSKPLGEAEEYIFNDVREAIRTITGRYNQRINETKERIKVVTDAMRKASGDTKAELEHQAKTLSQKLESIAAELKQEIRKIFPQNGESYFIDTIKDQIKALTGLVAQKTRELAFIVYQLAKETAQPKIEELNKMKERLYEEIARLKEQLRQKIREMFIPDDDMYIIDEVFIQIKENILKELSDLYADLKNLADSASEQGKKQVAAIKAKISNLRRRLYQLIRNKLMGGGTDEEVETSYSLVKQLRHFNEIEYELLINELHTDYSYTPTRKVIQ